MSQGHAWEATVSLYSAIRHPGNMAVPTATADVDASSGTVTFSNVTIDHHGRYYLQFRLMSTPAEFDLYAPSDAHIDVFPAGALRSVENLF